MKLLKKSLSAIFIVLLSGLPVFSQGSYDWNEHNEAMDQIDWGKSMQGWLILLVIIGIIYLSRTNNSKKKTVVDFNLQKEDNYRGEIKDGKKNGKGKMIYANGDIYDGDWKNDKYEGKGKIIYSNGGFQEGNWKNGKLFGWGKSSFPNGPIYEGEYGKKENSERKLKLWNSYTNEWEICNSYSMGIGKYIYFDFNYLDKFGKSLQVHGDVFEGEKRMVERYQVWSNRFFGKMFYNVSSNLNFSSKGDVYEGEFDSDFKRDGMGKMTYANGIIYEGKWCENKRVEDKK